MRCNVTFSWVKPCANYQTTAGNKGLRLRLPLDAAILHCSDTFMLAVIVTPKEKDLGVTMKANMKVSEQCRIAASKGNQVLGMIRRNMTYI